MPERTDSWCVQEAVERCLRTIRDWQPINTVVTGLVKGICDLFDCQCPDFVVRHLPKCGTISAYLPNGSELQLWSRQVDFIGNHLYWRGWTADEPEALPIFYILAQQSNLILDIGANTGLYSLVGSYANPAARIFAFEPHPGARQQLSNNVRRNGRTNIEIVPYAVSDRSGRQSFYCPDVPLQSIPVTSSLSRDFIGRSTDAELRCVRVDVTTIDRFCGQRRIDKIDLAKLDIEGLEPEAIEGMRRMIERSRPHLFVEIIAGKGTDDRIDRLARQFAYNAFALDLDKARFQPRIVVDDRRRNYLLTRFTPAEVRVLMNTAHSLTTRHRRQTVNTSLPFSPVP